MSLNIIVILLSIIVVKYKSIIVKLLIHFSIVELARFAYTTRV